MKNKKFQIWQIIFVSFIISISLNLYFLNNSNFLLGNINGEPQIDITKLAILTISLVWETSILSLIFYLWSKKLFK